MGCENKSEVQSDTEAFGLGSSWQKEIGITREKGRLHQGSWLGQGVVGREAFNLSNVFDGSRPSVPFRMTWQRLCPRTPEVLL